MTGDRGSPMRTALRFSALRLLTAGEESRLVVPFRLPGDDGVRFPDRAAFIAGSFQTFVCDLRPKLLKGRGGRLVRMPFGLVRSPRHLTDLSQITGASESTSCAHAAASSSSRRIPTAKLPDSRRILPHDGELGRVGGMTEEFGMRLVLPKSHRSASALRSQAAGWACELFNLRMKFCCKFAVFSADRYQ